ncbi:MAG: type II toxin-antitoxin system MqsA family antitoxin [Chloroflexi bacterium]|nr:type II toxin-antitoxin system MqsA family antitoxin [Chloroflexota bacterium]
MTEGPSARCAVCGAKVVPRTVTYTQEIGGLVYIISDVPADVCSQCGERYLIPDTVEVIQELIERGGLDKVAEIKHVPVYRLPPVAGGR